MNWNPKTILQTFPGDVVGYDLQFVAGAKAVRTIMAEIGDPPDAKTSFSVCVDIDENRAPVAISFVHHVSAPLDYSDVADSEAKEVLERIYQFASQLVKLHLVANKLEDPWRATAKEESARAARKAATYMGRLEELEQASPSPLFACA